MDVASDIAERVAVLAESSHVGVRVHVMRVQVPPAGVTATISRRVEALGWVAVDLTGEPAGWVEPPHGRHVVLCCRDDTKRLVIPLVRRLSAVSPRGHLVVVLSRCSPIASPPRARSPTPRDQWIDLAATAASRLIARLEFERAEALLAGIRAEVTLRDRPVPARVAAVGEQLRVARKRTRESAMARQPAGRGVPGVRFWRMGNPAMQFVEGLPALLQIVHDADDELAALTGGCRWLRQQAGVDRAAIVASDGSLVATEGWTRADLAAPSIAGIVRSAAPATSSSDGLVVMGAPIRHTRVAIGAVLARGRAESQPALEQAALTLAALMAPSLRSRLDAVASMRDVHAKIPEILGRSVAMAALREAIARAAAASFPVLIDGESGTGKELVARALHRLSPRRERPFSAINCAALTDELIEAELFGHARGAFTGAIGQRTGLFEQAHGGTLFLDEVSELSPRAQAKLLRVLQEREIRRLGENATRRIDVRIVAATNVPLSEAAARGAFREDLRFRLAVVRISVPALRDRVDDIPLLAQAFWRQVLADTGKRAVLTTDAVAGLCRHAWPGNVRELQNVMAALAVLAPARGRVLRRHVHQAIGAGTPAIDSAGVPLETARRLFEQRMVSSALARNGGRRAAAARELGLTRQGLTKALRRLGLGRREPSIGVA
jgi:DNA-binding NtrC family response regulator